MAHGIFGLRPSHDGSVEREAVVPCPYGTLNVSESVPVPTDSQWRQDIPEIRLF